MGNQLARFVPGNKGKKNAKKSRSSSSSSNKQRPLDEELLKKQMLAFALQQQAKSARLDRAASQRNNPNLVVGSVPERLPRSASSRPRSVSDPLVQPHELVNGSIKAESLATKHFVLVHGGGLGAWCWYKSISLLQETGCEATAIDLTGSGIDFTDPNTITTLAHYVKPLTEFLEKLPEGQKVILVGHDFGGVCISYAMELFPNKVAKAIFVCAAMIANGQRASDIFASELMSPDNLLTKSQHFIYASANSSVPTALEFDKGLLKDLFFNQCPSKDIALATVSMRPVPFGPTLERLVLTNDKYGSVRRFFIHTAEDRVLTPAIQDSIVSKNPPERVLHLKASDHSPFFSKPQSLHKLLLEIAALGP